MPDQRYFIIRLDIDTPQCLQIGVPSLIRLANEFGVFFTFFANMGCSVSRLGALKKLINKNQQKTLDVPKLSNLSKLGIYNYLKIALFNQSVGLGYPHILQQLHASGHEVGLHGGRNHALWQNFADSWSHQQLAEEVDWGVQAFNSVLGYKPELFSSPGWNSPGMLADVLNQAGFEGMADSYSLNADVTPMNHHFQNINTNLVGRPGGVGYFEYCASQGLSEMAIFEKIQSELNIRNINVIYDHPYYLVNNHYAVLQRVIDYALKSGIKIVTIGQLIKLNE